MDGLRDRLQLSLLRRVAELAGELEEERNAELAELLVEVEARAEEVRDAEEHLEELERRLERVGAPLGNAQKQVERLLAEVERRHDELAERSARLAKHEAELDAVHRFAERETARARAERTSLAARELELE